MARDPDRRLRVAWLAIGRRRHRLRDLPRRQLGRVRRPVRLQRDPARALVQGPVAAVGGHRGHASTGSTTRTPDTAFMLRLDGARLHRRSGSSRRWRPRSGCARRGGVDGGQLAALVSTGFVLSVPRYSLVRVRDHGLGGDDRRPLAGGRLDPGARVGRGDGLLHLAVRLRPMGVLSRATEMSRRNRGDR